MAIALCASCGSSSSSSSSSRSSSCSGCSGGGSSSGSSGLRRWAERGRGGGGDEPESRTPRGGRPGGQAGLERPAPGNQPKALLPLGGEVDGSPLPERDRFLLEQGQKGDDGLLSLASAGGAERAAAGAASEAELGGTSAQVFNCVGSPAGSPATTKLGRDSTRGRILACLEEEDEDTRQEREGSYFSLEESANIEEFRQQFLKQRSSRSLRRLNTLASAGRGPWGISSHKGGEEDAWDDIDATSYKVRGPNYLRDKKKVSSPEALSELLVVDLFMSDSEIVHASGCGRAKTVHRLRRDGEERKLLVLNVRQPPLHLVAVWAIPELTGAQSPPRRLLARFVEGSMPNEEMLQRLKVIPRIVQGPWVAKRIVGDNSTTVIGRNLPMDCLVGQDDLEISVNVARSSMAERICRVLQRAAQALDVEIALLLEGQSEDELPEQVLGGFRLTFADLSRLRWL